MCLHLDAVSLVSDSDDGLSTDHDVRCVTLTQGICIHSRPRLLREKIPDARSIFIADPMGRIGSECRIAIGARGGIFHLMSISSYLKTVPSKVLLDWFTRSYDHRSRPSAFLQTCCKANFREDSRWLEDSPDVPTTNS